MVIKATKKIFNIFDREIKGVHQAALLLGFMGILTKLTALLRDRIFASRFGAGIELDIYFTAFRIPDFIFNLSLFITAGAALIPYFLKEVSRGGNKPNLFLGRIIIIFSFFISAISLIGFIFASYFIKITAPGFNSQQLFLLTSLTKIMLFSPIILGFSGIFSIVIQSFQKFFIYTLSPLLYNAGIIIGVLFFYPKFGMIGLAFGVILGAMFHLLIQIPSLIKLRMVPEFNLKLFVPEIKESISAGIVRSLGLSLNQIVLITLTALASFMVAGSITIFNFSNNLQSIPLTVIGLSYSLAAFPVISRFFADNNKEEFFRHISTSARHIIFWSIPVSILFIVLRAQIVRVVLGTGSFGWEETRLTAASLAVFSVSITAQSLILLFSRSYYAAGKTAKPIFINIVSSLFIIIIALLSFLFIKSNLHEYLESFLRLRGIQDIEILSLPIAYSFGSVLNILLLWSYFKRDFGFINNGIFNSLKQSVLGGIVLGIVSYASLQFLSGILNLNTFLGIFFQGFLSSILGIMCFGLVLRFLGNKELKEIISSLKTKFWKAGAISEEGERLT